ncbi:MAG: YbaB/EbfC family nucleoid-associated protein [Chitinivibrionia bacterium]|nr:YbaB/EbfC family nucleoid-associated protein [Chitinivibrionia bacterium]MCL1947339.1 YbaB/EbfC family nucleoid-associated protein [Chitinivibrionia bacterium]
MQKMMKQAQKMQAEYQKSQAELAKKEVVGTSGGSMVKIVMDGNGVLQSVKIAKEAVDPDDVEMLEDLVAAAIRNASDQVKKLSDDSLGAMTSGLGLSGF